MDRCIKGESKITTHYEYSMTSAGLTRVPCKDLKYDSKTTCRLIMVFQRWNMMLIAPCDRDNEQNANVVRNGKREIRLQLDFGCPYDFPGHLKGSA